MDDTNLLSEAESKYFDTQGQTDLPLPEAEPVEKPAAEEKPAAKTEAELAAKDEKSPAQIEVVGEEEIDGAEPDARKYVKVGVVRREREEKQKLRLRAEQAEAGRAELERRIQAMQPREQQREPEPGEVIQQTANELRQIKGAIAENAARQQFVNNYHQKAQEFITGTEDEPGVPDFPDAYKHALNIRRAMHEAAGFNPQQINAMLESEEAAIVERALMDGQNPASAIYKIAKTLGYAPKAADKKGDPVNEQVERQADTADKTLQAAKKLEKIAKGMDKNKSLSGGGGGTDAPSLEELLEMPEEEFAKHTGGKKWAGLMGG